MNLMLLYHKGRVNGVLTSIIDTYINLSKRMDITLKINTYDVGQFYLLCKRNSFFGFPDIMKCVTLDTEFEADKILTSSKTLYDDISLKCDELILLDSLDIARAKYKVFPDPTSPCENTTLLCTPATKNDWFKCLEYYHKFSMERLITLKPCQQMLYMRLNKDSAHMKGDVYYENIGKTVFEMLYLNKSVSYYGDKIHDGLYYYLKLFGIDGEQDYLPLLLKPSDIEDKLFMKDDDLLLELL